MTATETVEAPTTPTTTITFTVLASSLKPALRDVAKAAAGRTTLPVLQHVRLTADYGLQKDGQNLYPFLTLGATDLAWSSWAQVPLKTLSGPALDVTVPAATFAPLVASYPDMGEVSASWDGRTLTVRCGRSRATFRTIDGREHPDLPTPQHALLTCMGSRLALADKAVTWAASTVVERVDLACAHVVVKGADAAEGPALVVEAAHEFGAARWWGLDDGVKEGQTAEAKSNSRLGADFLVPAGGTSSPFKHLCEAARAAGDARVTLAVQGDPANPTAVVLEVPDGSGNGRGPRRVGVRLAEAKYPDLTRHLAEQPPTEQGAEATVAASALDVALRRIVPFGQTVLNDGKPGISGNTVVLRPFETETGDGALSLRCTDTVLGDGEDEIDAELTHTPATGAVEFAYGSNHLAAASEAVKATGGDDASLRLSLPGPLSPARITCPQAPGLVLLLTAIDIQKRSNG